MNKKELYLAQQRVIAYNNELSILSQKIDRISLVRDIDPAIVTIYDRLNDTHARIRTERQYILEEIKKEVKSRKSTCN